MNKIKSPLKHEEGNAIAHSPYANEEAYHKANPESIVKEVEEKEVKEVKENDPGLRIPTTEEMAGYELEVEERVDEAMVEFENSGEYSEKELAKIRKRKTLDVKSTPKTESLLPSFAQNIQQNPVNKKEDDILLNFPKKEDTEDLMFEHDPTGHLISPTGSYSDGAFEYTPEMQERDEEHQKVASKLMAEYGTDDPNAILEGILGEDAFYFRDESSTFEQFGEAISGVSIIGEEELVENYPELPDFGDDAINKYIYESFARDYGTDFEEKVALGLDYLGLGTAGGDKAKEPWKDPNSDYFKEKFFSEYTDLSAIKNIYEKKLGANLEVESENKYGYGGSLDKVKEVNSTYYRGLNKDVYDMFEAGDFEDAVKLNEENGFVTMYNSKNGLINWSEAEIDYSYWEVEGFESEEAYRKHVAANTTTMTFEEEAKAQEYATRRGPEVLKKARSQKTFEVVAALQTLVKKHGKESFVGGDNTSLGGMLIDLIQYGSDEELSDAIDKLMETGELVSNLRELPEDQKFETYNKAFGELMVLNRALDLNQDPNFIPEESQFVYREDNFGGMTEDEQVEVAGDLFADIGLIQKEEAKDIKRSGATGGSIEAFGKEITLRDFAEGGRDFVVDIMPLIASVVITKKIAGPQLGLLTSRLKEVLRFGSKSKNWGRFVDFNVAGIVELGVLSGADKIGNNLFGMEEMVYNPGRGGQEENFNPWFAYGLGVGNEFSKKAIQRLQTSWAPTVMNKISKFPVLDQVAQSGLGATGGVGAMELGKLFSGQSELVKYLDEKIHDKTDYSRYLEEGFRSEEEYRAHIVDMQDEAMYDLVKHMGSDWLGMFGMNFFSSRTYKAVGETIENYNIKNKRTSKATKKLTSEKDPITEDSSAEVIEDAASRKEDAAREKHSEVFNSEKVKKAREKKKNGEELSKEDLKAIESNKKSKENLDKEIKDINTAKEDLLFRHDLAFYKEAIGKDKKRWNRFDKETFVLQQTLLSGKPLSGKNAKKFGEFTDVELDYYIKKLESQGLGNNFPGLRETLTMNRDFYKEINTVIKETYKGNLTDKQFTEIFDKSVKARMTRAEINRLSSNNKDGLHDSRIEILKEKLTLQTEGVTEVSKKLDAVIEKKVRQELVIAKKIAEELGAEFEIAKETKNEKGEVTETVDQSYERQGGEKGTAGFHERGGLIVDKNGVKPGEKNYETTVGKDRIVVNPAEAAKARTIGTGIHEVIHYVLRDALKETYVDKDGKTSYRVSESGRAIIDGFLKTLDAKDRKILDKRIEDNYATKQGIKSSFIIDPITKKPVDREIKVPENEYYEEYLTAYVEALKNKEINLDVSNAKKVQDVFMPYLNKVFKNLGVKERGEAYSVEDANGLKNMLEDLFDASNRGVNKWQMKDFMVKTPELAVEAYKQFSKVPISPEVKAKMDKINKIAEGNYKELVEKLGTKKAGEQWNKEWKGPDSNPMEGRWFDTFLKTSDNIYDVILKKTSEFNIKSGGQILNEKDFAGRVVQEIGGLNTNQRNIGGLMRTFDIREVTRYEQEGKYPGLSGFVNYYGGNFKFLNVFKTAKDLVKDKKSKSLEEEGVERKMDLDAFEAVEAEIYREGNDRMQLESDKLTLHEAFDKFVATHKGVKVKEIHDAIKNEFRNEDGSTNIEKLKKYTEGKNYKTLEGMFLPETVRIFTGEKRNKRGELVYEKIAAKIKKKANLDVQDIEAVQPMLDKFMPTLFDFVIPEGFVTKEVKYVEDGMSKSTQVPGESTGVPRGIMAVTHSRRSIAGETTAKGKKVRSKENYFGQYKKPYSVELMADLREAVGVMKDGALNTNPRNVKKGKEIVKKGVGEEVKGLLSLTNKILTSQPIRELLDAEGRVFESIMLKLADGKPSKSFSNVTEVKNFVEKLTGAAIESQANVQIISEIIRRQENGGTFGFKMLEDVYGNEITALREIFENGIAEAKGLDIKFKLPIESKYNESLEKKQAESNKKMALDLGLTKEQAANVSYKVIEKNMDLIEQRKENQIKYLNELPFHISELPANVLAPILTSLGVNSRAGRYVTKTGGEVVNWNKSKVGTARESSITTLESHFGKERLINKGKKYDGRYDKVKVKTDWGPLKRQIGVEGKRLRKLVNSKNKKIKITQSQADIKLVEFVEGKLSWNGDYKEFAATEKANADFAREWMISRKKTFDLERKTLGEEVAVQNMIAHNQAQSNHTAGVEKAMVYNLEHVAWEGSSKESFTFENKKGEQQAYSALSRKGEVIELHWEHERQLLNNNEHQALMFVNNKAKYNKKTGEPIITKEFLKDLDAFIETSTQSLIPKELQLKNDAKGTTSYSNIYAPGGKANLTTNAILNVLTKKGSEANQIYMSGKNRGKRVGDVLASEYTLEQMKEVLQTLDKSQWGSEAYKVDAINLKEHKVTLEKNIQSVRNVVGPKYKQSSKVNSKDVVKDLLTIDKAIELGRLTNKKKRGMSAFDFDETIIDKGENFIIAKKGNKTVKMTSGEWPLRGPKLAEEGYAFDFKDFVNVRGGIEGPLFKKMKARVEKFGPENNFILTARPANAATAIHGWLKSKGINIPLKNITGLGNSTGEAKAMWMLEKFSEGYNDMYFVDDAMPNVKAVKDVLDQLDIKSDVQQAKQYSRTKISKDFNKILEEVDGVRAETTYSEGKGRQEGAKKGKWKWWGSSGMEDFSGLVTYAFAGKGKKGESHKKFFEDNLQKPYNRAYNEMHSVKQVMSNDYTSLRKSMPEVVKQLRDKVGESVYTVENAVRTYLWNKAGYEIPGMSKRDVTLLDNFVKSNEQMVAFAESVSMITKLKEGYAKPKDYWLAETITSDLQKLADTHYRDLSLTEFVENRKEIFGEWRGGKLVGENMNKIEALYGSKHRENMENILWRMENGTNRPHGTDAVTQKWMNWINRSGGAIMFFNVKSAALQTISSINYMNGSFNNPLRAAKAFANQPQYWKDFAKIFNSDMLLQRRSGLKLNVEAAELLSALDGKSNKAERALAYLLEKGFIPTKYADSFAIASGGSTFYRNRVKDLVKKGVSEKQAEKQAWIDFTELTEATQQSSRPDFISAQQASPIGRPILMFANTPMQMFRRHKRRVQDLVNNRGSRTENLLSAAYYGFAQAAAFSFLSNAMFAKDEDDLEKVESGFNEKKDTRFIETIVDSYLRGMGTMGAVPAAIKNSLLEFKKQNEKDWNADYDEVVYDLLAVSPPIGSKIRKVVSATKEWKYNKEIIPEMGFSIDNPAVSMTANLLSASLNVPADRLLMKINNLRDATNSDYETWQRISLLTGVNRWALGLGKRDAVVEAKEKVKEKKKIITKKKQIIKKEEKKKEKEKEEKKVIENNIEKQKKEKEEGKKDIKCAAVNKSGKRCGTTIQPGKSYCTIHEKAEQNESGKKSQCKKIKKDKKRCGMQTNSKSGYCYYHD